MPLNQNYVDVIAAACKQWNGCTKCKYLNLCCPQCQPAAHILDYFTRTPDERDDYLALINGLITKKSTNA